MSFAKIIYKTGRVLTIAGIAMFVITAFLLTYRGDLIRSSVLIDEVVSCIGVISFWSWMPAIIFGGVFWSFKKVAR